MPAYKRLANNLAPLSLQFLADLSWADKSGRNPKQNQPLEKDIPEIKEFLAIADKANVRLFPEPPLLLGRDIADCVQPGPAMGKFLAKAYELQIEHGINNKDELKKLVLTQIKK